MSDENSSSPTNPIDPLTVGELISLAEAAKLSGFSIRDIAQRRRLKAKKIVPGFAARVTHLPG